MARSSFQKMSIEDKSATINIIGSGVMGLSLAMELLEDGYTDIHLFDKKKYNLNGYLYSKGCNSASSDINKVFKTGYGNKYHYQEMAEKSLEKFLQWNEQIKTENWEGGDPVYIKTGFLNLNVDGKALTTLNKTSLDISLSASIEECKSNGLNPKSLDPFKFKESGKSINGVLDMNAGITIADKSCRWVLHLISKLNTNNQLKLHWGQSVKILTVFDVSKKKAIGVQTDDGVKHLASLNVVAAGPWVTELIPESKEKIEVAAGTVALFKVSDPKLTDQFSGIPSWIFSIPNGSVYGFPVTHGYLKIGYRGVKFTNSKVKTSSMGNESNFPLVALDAIKGFVKEFIPEIKKVSCTRLCWHADTSDSEFLISYVPNYSDNSLFIIGGDSGHAFKMLGSLGGYSLDILKSKADPKLTSIFSWNRNRSSANSLKYQHTLENTVMARPTDLWIREQHRL